MNTYIAPVPLELLEQEAQHIGLHNSQHATGAAFILNQAVLKLGCTVKAETLCVYNLSQQV